MTANEINIPKTTKYVRMDLNYCTMKVIPYDLNKFKITMIVNVNPKLKVIPVSLINFVSRKVIID